MSKRSKACEFSKPVRDKMYERDKKCIFCGTPLMLTCMHYIPRSKGGLGIIENGAIGCIECHHELDNGKNRRPYQQKFKEYLNALYPDFADEDRIYDKWRGK